jgi:hypothetical protein
MRRWRPRHLLVAWSTYWALLAVYAFGPPTRAFLRASAQPGAKLTVAATVDDDILRLTVTNAAATVWTGGVPFFTAVLWVVLPPLFLWLLWLGLGARRDTTRAAAELRG